MNFQSIGGLMVQLAADVSALKKDMDEAEKVVNKGGMAMAKAWEFAKGALIGMVGALSVGAFAGWIKGAIDAADETSKLAQRIGVATADVAGLSLAFELGGSSSGGMASAMGRLQKQMVEGAKGFKDLGVETRNADGSLRSSRDVLYDVADAIANTENETLKAARAQEIFGKSGAELVPLLNGGAQGFRDMADMAVALGLAIDEKTGKSAEEFNDTLDLLGRVSGGVATQIMAKMLPSLNAAAGGFLEMVKNGNFVDKMANGLVTTFKILYTGVLGVMEVFSTLGKLLGGTIARLMAELSGLGEAVVKVFQGDFKGAAEAAQNGFKQSAAISKEMSTDIKQGWQATGKAIGTTWDETQSTTVKALAEMNKASKAGTAATKEQEEATKKAAEAEAKRLDEVKKLTQGLDKQIATMAAQEEQSGKLSNAQKMEIELNLKLKDGTLKLTEAEEKEVRAKLAQIKAGEERQEELAKEKKWLEDTAKENEKFTESLDKQTQSIQAEVEKLRESNQMLLLNKEETAALEIAKLEEQAVAKDRLATWAEENMLGADLVQKYKDQAQGLRDLAKLKGEKVHLEAAKEANEAWQKTTEEIGKSFTDSLFRAFEEGKSFSEAFMGSLKNLFKTTVLKLLIQPVQQGMNNMIGNMFGMGGGGAGGGAGGGFGNLLGSLGNGLSAVGGWFGEGSTVGGWLNTAGGFLKGGASSTIGSMFGNFGAGWGVGSQAAAQGIGSVWNMGTGMMNAGATSGGLGALAGGAATIAGGFMAGRGLGQMVSGGYGLGGGSGNTAVNIGSAIGAIWGPLGSAIGGAIGGLVNRAFGRKPKEYSESGIQGSLGAEGVLNGQTYANWKQKGGWFRSDKSGTDLSALDSQMAGMLGEGAKAVLNQTQAWAKALKLPADQLANVTTSFKIKLTENEEENSKALADLFSNYQSQLSNTFQSTLAPFQKAGETLTETLSRLTMIQSFSEGLNQFGGVFSKIAGLSISAKEELLGFAGGMESFIAKTQSFVENYYTEQEKFGLAAKQVQDALTSFGINGADLSSRADFRKLVESQDIQTTEGRKMLNQLLDLAPTFASIGDYLEKNQKTLADAVAEAPTTELLQSVMDDKETQDRYHNELVDRLTSLDSSVVDAGKMTNATLERLIAQQESQTQGLIAAMERGWKFMEDYWMQEQP